ncbi:MAG: LysR family transcriptional regulator [Sandaracinaceae bacterium]
MADLMDVMVFAAVVRGSGFSAAARELELPASTVSRRVKRLEERLGVKLLHRTTRRVGLTPAGRAYYERIAPVPGLLEEAERAVLETRETPKGTLRVAVPPEDGGVVWATLQGFLRDYPEVDLEILHSLASVDLIADEVDVALRGGPPPDSADVAAHLLWDSRMLLAASPSYLARRGTPTQVDELNAHDGICMDGWAPQALRRLKGDGPPLRITMHNRVRSNSLTTARNAALDGLGIAPLLEMTCRAELASGALVEVLRGALPSSAQGWVLYPLERERSAAAQALIDHLIAQAPPPG